MAVNERLLEQLEGLRHRPFDGEVYRHTLRDWAPETENNRGGRWNPPGTAAIYTSLDRETVVAEGNYTLESHFPKMRLRRVVHRMRVELRAVVDLRSTEVLRLLGVDDEALRADDPWACQRVGEAASILERDGILVPSARASGANLVIYPPTHNPREIVFERIDFEVIDDPQAGGL